MSKVKILVTDDEAAIRELLVNALTTTETDVFAAEDGTEALELAGQHGFFDLVVTDMMMPVMDGIELARRLWTGHYAGRFLFISGFAEIKAMDAALGEFEAAEFLAKPFRMRDLMDAVASLCEQPPAIAVTDT